MAGRTSLPGADPDVGSWVVTLSLLGAGIMSLAVAWRAGPGDRRARVFWMGVGISTSALAANKQIDAQDYLFDGTAAGLLDPVVLRLKDLPPVVVGAWLLIGAAVSTLAVAWATSRIARFRLAAGALVVLVLVALLRTAEIVDLGPVSARLDHDAALPFELAGAVLLFVAASHERWLCQRSHREQSAARSAP